MPQTNPLIPYLKFVQLVKKLTTSHQGRQYQQSLAQYPIDFVMDLIYDQSQSLDQRRMACSILKLKVSNKEHCQQQQVNIHQTLARLQTLFMINSTNNTPLYKLQSSIELVIEKIFQVYFDDMQKIDMFQKIVENLTKQPACKQVKHLMLLEMMVRQMNYLSVNSEVLVGLLVLFLGDFLGNVGEMFGGEGAGKDSSKRDEACEVMGKVVGLMREIKEIVDQNNQDEENVVGEFMTNSKQLRAHLFAILKLQAPPIVTTSSQSSPTTQQPPPPSITTINTSSPLLNKTKSTVLNLWHDIWQYHSQLDMLQLLLTTILTITKPQIIDQTENIITTCLILLQRSSCHRQYAPAFFKLTHNLTLKLFELICITESEFSLLENDGDYFIELSDDYCKQQEMETLKTRAGSLLSNLTMTIDGYLTFVTQVALVAMRQQLAGVDKPPSEVQMWTTLMSAWTCSQQQLIETSILILSSLSDQIQKRKDLHLAITHHLSHLAPSFTPPSPLSKSPLFIMRYMQLYSFYSFPGCLDHFIRYYSTHPLYQKQLSKSFQTLMRYYDKKSKEMERYVGDIANSIMLLGEELTPLLEQEVMRNNRVIQNFKENVLEKLVVWFMVAYEKQEVLRINKLSTLIVRLLHDNMKTETHSDTHLTPFTSLTLSTYLQKVYKPLSHTHPCQQTIIQIAISHLQYLYDLQQIDLNDCQNFYRMAKLVTQRNELSLNDCLLLFNSLVCPDVVSNRKGRQKGWRFHQLTLSISVKILGDVAGWLGVMWGKGHVLEEERGSDHDGDQREFVLREEDVWELLQLAEICLFQIEANQPLLANKSQSQIQGLKNTSGTILNFGLKIADQCQSKTLKCKVISVILQIVEMFPENSKNYGFLSHLKYPNPCDFPADECRKYSYCLSKIMKNYMNHFDPQLRIRILRVVIDLVYFLQNEKAHVKAYDQKLFINGDAVALNAIQKRSKIYSAFDFRIDFEPHEEFRALIQQYPVKEELNFLNQQQAYQGKIRDLADKIIVNDKTRKRIVVKRNV